LFLFKNVFTKIKLNRLNYLENNFVNCKNKLCNGILIKKKLFLITNLLLLTTNIMDTNIKKVYIQIFLKNKAFIINELDNNLNIVIK